MSDARDSATAGKIMIFNNEETYHYVVNCRVVNEVTPIVLRLCLECLIHMRCPRNDEYDHQDDTRSTWCQKVEQAIRRSKWYEDNKIFHKNYKKSDVTNLIGIIKGIIGITIYKEYSTLWLLINQINTLRNKVTHADRICSDPDTKERIHNNLNDIVLLLGELFPCHQHPPIFFQNMIQMKISEICPENEKLNEKILIGELKQLLLKEFPEQWSKIFMRPMKSITLPCNAMEVSLSDIFQETDFEVISDPNKPGCLNPKKRKTFPSSVIFSQKHGASIDIIVGDPGAGKSTFLKNVCLEFDEKQTDDIKSFEMMFYFDKNTNKNSFWEFFSSTCSESAKNLPEALVIRALTDLKIIIAIDGFDECNTASKIFVKDIIQTFLISKTVTFLITTRPGSTKEIVEKFESQGVKPRVLNIKSIQDKKKQEKFIKRVIAPLPDINEKEILDAFRVEWAELNSHFVRPIGLISFIALCHKSKKPSHELDLNQLMYCKVQEKMSERIPKRNNCKHRANSIMVELGKCCLHWIQSNQKTIDETIFDNISREIFNKLGFANDGAEEVSVDSLLSCVFQHQEHTANNAKTYIFSHHNQREFFASKMLTTQLMETSSRSVLEIFQQLTPLYLEVKEEDFVR